MAKKKSPLEAAAGKLISAIQKEWDNEMGEPEAEESENIMHKGHDILKAARNNNISSILNGMNVTQFLGDIWVHKHPNVKQSIANFEAVLNAFENV
ncbi:MAG: hypothetical protein OEY09_10965 [Gammaproteobacteria bacterium]|nr:hypothetical protein [Gammaproteobacteria bacterium]